MADIQSQLQLRRMVFTAEELRQITGWDYKVVEDYLATIENLLAVAGVTDLTSGQTTDIQAQSQLRDGFATVREITEQMLSPTPRESNESFEAFQPSRVNRQTIKSLSTETVEFDELRSELDANTNTPAGTTEYQLEVYDKSGVLLGYIPVYGSPW